MSNPTRHTLMNLYTTLHNGLTAIGIKPKEIINEKTRDTNISPNALALFETALKPFTLEEKIYLRALNDQQRYFLGDDLMQVALAMNVYLPKFRDLETQEKKDYVDIVKFTDNSVITAADLAFNHLGKERPSYLRRLITAAVESSNYYMQTPALPNSAMEEMQLISANWVLEGKKHDEDALKILSLLGPDGRPTELRDTDVIRFKYVSDLMPGLLVISNFKRSDSALFSRFIVLLPSALTWFLGNSDHKNFNAEEEDAVMDLLETTMTFMRAFQANADNASRIRQLLHHGFPVYKDLMDLAHSQSYLMSWNFEGIIYRLSHNLGILLRDRKNEQQMTRFLMASGILQAYARHKNAYIKR